MAAITAPKRAALTKGEKHNLMVGLLFVSPWLIGFFLWTVYPVLSSIYYSFFRYDLITEPIFLGFGNYIEIFTDDPRFWKVVGNTLFYVGLSVPLGVISAFLIANLLNAKIAGRSFFRAIFYIPAIVPAICVAMVWLFIYNIQYGVINSALKSLELPVVPFLSNPDLAKPSLIVIHIWAQGTAVVIFLASLQDVPRSLYEAATVDGANAWDKFRNITIPMTSPIILYTTVLGIIGGFQTFLLPYLLTNGGPAASTEFYAMHLYRNAFQFFRMGKATALAWIMFLVVAFLTIILFKTSGRWVFYGGDSK